MDGDGGPDDGCDAAPNDDRSDLRADELFTVDDVLNCLANSRRRFVLYTLEQQDVVELDELAAEVAAREAATSPAEVSGDHRERVATQLVHTHLPKLAQAQFVEYDPRSQVIRYRDPPRLLQTLVRLLARLEGQSIE